MRNAIYSLVLIYLLPFSVPAQGQITSELLEQDLLIFLNIILGTSPTLTDTQKTDLASLFAREAELLEPMTVIEFTRFLADLDIESGFDEHASLELQEEVLMPLITESRLFPLPFVFLNDEVVVNSTQAGIPYGSPIYALNGTPIDSVIYELSEDLSTFSRKNIERQFSLLYLIRNGRDSIYTVSYTENRGSEKILEKNLEGIQVADWVKMMNEESVYPLNREKMSNLINQQFYPEKNTYYLQVNSFNWDKDEKKGLLSLFSGDERNFNKAFKSAFTQIRKTGADNLILDLRFNSGGNLLVPGLLFSYLARQPYSEEIRVKIPDFILPEEAHITRLDDQPADDRKDIERFISRYESQFTESASNYVWEVRKETNQPPQKMAFNGTVYLLVGGRSISASSYFTSLFKSQQRGYIVGEEIGGSHHSLTAGTSVTYTLPNTQIMITVPLMEISFSDQLYEAVPELKIQPDIPVSTEARYRYFLEKKDPELELVLEMIAQKPE